MKLYLSIIPSGDQLGSAFSVTLDHDNATIGRLHDNTLVLPDAKKYISGHHAIIQYRAPDYIITDTSTNGVLINRSSIPLGRGNSVRLSDGDHIHIGDYSIAVRLVPEDDRSVDRSSTFDKELVPEKNSDFDPFAFTGVDEIKKAIEDNELIPSDWKSSPEPLSQPAIHDKTPARQKGSQTGSIDFEHISAYEQAFDPFKGQKEAPPSARPGPEPTETSSDIFDEDWYNESVDQKKSVKPSPQASPFADFPTIEEKTTPPIIPTPKPTRTVPTTAETPASPKPETSSAPAPASRHEEEFVRNFLCGAGLEGSLRAESLNAESFHIIGKMLKESVQGTLDVLIGRTKIKNEMHLDITTIRARQNNPIKFSVSAEEAMMKLLTGRDKAYLPPEEAIKEVFDDIRAHQFAVIAGMRTALLTVLKRFDPEKLEHRLQETSPIAASIPFHKQAKLWQLFEQLYKELGHEAEDNFYHLFGQVFAETYEQQMQTLKKSSQDQPPYSL